MLMVAHHQNEIISQFSISCSETKLCPQTKKKKGGEGTKMSDENHIVSHGIKKEAFTRRKKPWSTLMVNKILIHKKNQ